jgi:hypothetical protein
MFDHLYEGEDKFARGGLSKMAYLVAGVVPKSGFRHPILPRLLTELIRMCAVRYEDCPPDEEDNNIDPEQKQLNALLRKKYERKQTALQSSDWILDTFQNALRS